MSFHATAWQHYTAQIGEGTGVWAFSTIHAGAVIGKNCVIGERVHIGPNVIIGDNCKIQNSALIYEGVTIGNRVFIGPNVVTTNDIRPKATGEWRERFRQTTICDDVAIGANATILCGIVLGRGCEIGAGAIVTKDCIPWGRYYNPSTAALLMDKQITPTNGTVRIEP